MKQLLLTAAAMLGLTAVTLAQETICIADTFLQIPSMASSTNDVAVIGNKIYSVEAYSNNKTLTEYNISTGIASVISIPPFTAGETSLTVYNNNLYFFGGYNGSTTNIARKYDLITNTWQVLPNMPVSVTQASAVTLNGFIYITGGTLGSTIQYLIRFDPVSTTYTTLPNPSPMYSNSKLLVYNENIYCLGGHSTSGVSNKLSKFNIETNEWTALSPMPFNRTKLAAVVWGDYIYAFGGAISPLFTAQYNYLVYDFINDSWQIANQEIPDVIVGGAALVNDTIYLPNNSNSYKYFCGIDCNNDLVIVGNNSIQTGSTATFTATTSDSNPSYIWQSDFGQGFQTLSNYGNYSGVETNTLSISNVQLSEHNQPIRVITTAGACIDTSDVAIVAIADTCINSVNDTTYISVTDTLLINTIITSTDPPYTANTIKVFPNPASDHITIDYGNFALMNGYQLRIENSLGQQVFQTNISQQSDYLSLTSWGGNGLYFVRIIDPQGNTIDIRKIVLQ